MLYYLAGISGSDHGVSSWAGGSGQSTDASWNTGFEGNDWAGKVGSGDAWTNSGGGFNSGGGGFTSGDSGSSYDKEEAIKYVIVEKETAPEPIYPSSQIFPGSPMGGSPFSGASTLPLSLAPGSNEIVDSTSYPGAVVHVPLMAPGQPKYCVRCRILSCPTSCERVDEYGCHSCPCAPSRLVFNTSRQTYCLILNYL